MKSLRNTRVAKKFIKPILLRANIRSRESDRIARVVRRIARWTFPIWLYVSVSGVVVYLMLYWL